MATQAEKLARSLEVLKELRDSGRDGIRSSDLTRTHRQRLLAAGFLKEVMKGWYIPLLPDREQGESTSWYVSYWGFCADYLNARFGDDWCLSAEQSLFLHAGNQTIPNQLLVRSSRGGNDIVPLLFETTLMTVRASRPEGASHLVKDRLRIYSPPAALIAVTSEFFKEHSNDARAALGLIRDASEVLPVLLDGGHTTIAGRLVGAFENVGRTRIAGDILKAMLAAGFEVRKSDPFTDIPKATLPPSSTHPAVVRLMCMWAEMREPAISCFPSPPETQVDIQAYLNSVEESYTSDAYNSLSIEGYQVSEELIAKIRNAEWAPENNKEDRDRHDALAAKGYWDAFQQVKKSVERVLKGENPGVVADEDHGTWFREMNTPGVAAGLLRPSDLAGYRNNPVFISQSRYVPPSSEAVRDLMPAFFNLIAKEKDPAARVVLGHFTFVFIHPYLDGNGRIGRFLMNVMLAAGGYPWMVIPVDQHEAYMAALKEASIGEDIRPFARFLAALVDSS